jgi:hypothetical protein
MSDDLIQRRITRNMRFVLTDTHTSQSQLAGVLGLHLNAVNARMNGRSSWAIEDLQKIADHWDLHPWDLTGEPAQLITALSSSRGADFGGCLPAAIAERPFVAI